MDFRQRIVEHLKNAGVTGDILVEVPPQPGMGDFAFPCFPLAKQSRKAPPAIAQELAKKLGKTDFCEKVVATGPYVNFFIDKKRRITAVLEDVRKARQCYGSAAVKDKTVVVDYSAPNVGKPMGVHHLGSTVIGHALANILRSQGYNVVAVNHLGDWGTQFGTLIAAFQKEGDEKRLRADPVNYLLSLYVKFTAAEEKDPSLHEEAKAAFKRLEDGDKDAVRLWALFRDSNLADFKRIYARLGIEFDSYNGEAFYSDRMPATLASLKEKNLVEEDQGMLIVRMANKDMAPFIAQKSDEASTYGLRDLAAIRYRFETYTPGKVLYVVAIQQALHFQQVFEVAGRLGFDKEKLAHVSFGMMRLPEGKMSTRKGRIIFLEDVLDRAVELVQGIIAEKNPTLKDKATVAEQVGIGAVIFGYLMNDRVKDVEFDWDRMLDMEGDTGPYVQYTHARACAVLRKAGSLPSSFDAGALAVPVEYELAKLLEEFPAILASVLNEYKPHILAQFLLRLSHTFNEFYHQCPVISADAKTKAARLVLCDSSRQVLENGLTLLGLAAPEEM